MSVIDVFVDKEGVEHDICGVTTSDNSNDEFLLTDENDNVLMKLKDGHIKTKSFNSRTVSQHTISIANLSNRIDVLEGGGNVLIVRTTPEDGEYSTLTAAMAAASSGDTIYMYSGTYEEVGVSYKRGVKVRGIGEVIIKGEMANDADPTTQIARYATIDAFAGCDIENVTITAKNCRYCIHAQTEQGAEPSTYRLVNVTLIHYGNQGACEYQISQGGTIKSVFRAISCWGCGLNGGDRIYMDGCKMVGRMRCFSVHNYYDQDTTPKSTGACVGIMNNCEFISKGIDNDGSLVDFNDAIHIQHLKSNTPDLMVFNNCRANGFVVAQLTSDTDHVAEASIKTVICGTKNLKLAFNTYGGSGNNMTNQISTFVSHTDWYPVIQDEIGSYCNRGNVTIPAGYAVKKSTLGGVALMTSEDSADDFYGVALEAITVGETGDVKTSGYVQRIYCEGIRSTSLTDGRAIYVDANGAFATSGSVAVMTHEDNQNLLIR